MSFAISQEKAGITASFAQVCSSCNVFIASKEFSYLVNFY